MGPPTGTDVTGLGRGPQRQSLLQTGILRGLLGVVGLYSSKTEEITMGNESRRVAGANNEKVATIRHQLMGGGVETSSKFSLTRDSNVICFPLNLGPVVDFPHTVNS